MLFIYKKTHKLQFLKTIFLYTAILYISLFGLITNAYAATLTMPTTLEADTTSYVLLSSSGTTPSVSDFSTNLIVIISVTNGTIRITTTTGLTAPDGYSSGDWAGASEIAFEGSQTDVNNALATLSYQGSGSASTTLSAYATPTGSAYNPDNGHYYVYEGSVNLTWQTAKDNAAASTYNGLTGYLATITSQTENDFIKDKVVAGRSINVFLGASDAETEGAWVWQTGPENGTQFWSGGSDGSAVESRYENWASGEPGVSAENYTEFYNTGLWNDVGGTANSWTTYVIEYGGLDGETATEESSTSISITNLQDSDPTLESFTPADNSTGISLDSNLVLSFNEAVNVKAGANNDIVIKKTSDDSIFETIDAEDSTKVSGDGTTTITIDPASNLAAETEYYVQIGADAFDDSFSNSYAGISDTTSWSFTTAASTTTSSASSESSSSTSQASAPFCSDFPPAGTPDVFQIDTSEDSATIFFTPILGTSKYYISYSDENSNAEQHGVLVDLGSLGVQSFTINSLEPGKKYYFKVRGQNGCMPGEWSNIHSTMTDSNLVVGSIEYEEGEISSNQEENNAQSEKIVEAEIVKDEDENEEEEEKQNNYKVTILVQEKENPKPNTKVVIPELDREVITNDQGEVVIEDVPHGKYTFKLVDQAFAAEETIDVGGDNQDFDVVINLNVNEPLFTTPVWIGILAIGILSCWLLFKIKFKIKK